MTALSLLLALAAGISHAPVEPQGCAYTVPVLAVDRSQVMSGFMRTTDGGCLVWVNLAQTEDLPRRDVCQLGAHEAGHLGGLPHSTDPLNVMYSPFRRTGRSYC